MEARARLEPVKSRYAIVYERPGGDGEVSVVHPDPNWMAAALAGGVLPPVGVYHQLRCEWRRGEERCLMRVNEHPGDGWEDGRVTNGHLLHLVHPIGAMTEEQAMEYLLEKDVPLAVWHDHERANRPRFVICSRPMIPADRSFRQAWRLSDFIEEQAA